MSLRESILSQRYRVIAGTILLCVLLTLLRLVFHSRAETAADQARFESRTAQLAGELRQSVNERFSILARAQTPLAILPKLTRRDFSAIAQQIMRVEPAILSLQWVPRVWGKDRQTFEKQAQESGASGFRISEFASPGVLVAAADRESYYPVLYLEPDEPVVSSRLGYDTGSDPLLHSILRKAIDRAETLLTAAAQTAIRDQARTTVTALAPVYFNGELPEGAAMRRRQLTGFIAARYDVAALIEPIRSEVGDQLTLHVFEKAEHRESLLAAFGGNGSGEANVSPQLLLADPSFPLRAVRPLDLAGRQWDLVFRATPQFLDTSAADLFRILMEGVALGAILSLALLLACSAASIGSLNRNAEKIALSKTEEIENTRKLLDKHLRDKHDELLAEKKKSQTLRDERELLRKESEALKQKIRELEQERSSLASKNQDLDRHLTKTSQEARSALLTGAATARDLESNLAGTTEKAQRLAARIRELEELLQKEQALRTESEAGRERAEQRAADFESACRELEQAIEERDEFLAQAEGRPPSAERAFADMENAMTRQQDSVFQLQQELSELRQISEQQRSIQGELERKVAERSAALAASEARSRTLVQLTPVGIFYTDNEGRFVYVNDRFLQISDLVLEESRGEGWLNAVHPEDRQGVLDLWFQAIRAKSRFIAEFRCVHKDGSCRRVHAEAVLETGSAGTGYVGTVIDITDGVPLPASSLMDDSPG
jgi:PAS domain S-box-containing protein